MSLKTEIESYGKESAKRKTQILGMSAILAIALVLLVPLSLFTINAVYAQTTDPTLSDQLNAIVIAVGGLLGTLALIIGLAKQIYSKIAAEKIAAGGFYAKVADTLDLVSNSLEATDRGIKDNMDVIGLSIGSILNNDGIREKLGDEKSREILLAIQNEIKAWDTDIKKYYDTISPKLPANDETEAKLNIVAERSVPS